MDLCKVYILTNNINNTKYIGQTWAPNIYKRMGYQGNKYFNSKKLYYAIMKYGYKNFSYTILCYCFTQEEANSLEDYYINKYDTINNGYNIKFGGSNGKHSESTINKIRQSNTGRIVSEKTRKLLSKKLKGKTKAPKSEELKIQISEKMKNWHKNNVHPNLGNSRTLEEKLKISASLKGRKRNKEIIQKIVQTKKEIEQQLRNLELEKEILFNYNYNNNLIPVKFLLQKYNISFRMLRKICKWNNQELKGLRGTKITKDIEKLILEDYLNPNLLIKDIEEKYNIRHKRIKSIVKKLGYSKNRNELLTTK